MIKIISKPTFCISKFGILQRRYFKTKATTQEVTMTLFTSIDGLPTESTSCCAKTGERNDQRGTAGVEWSIGRTYLLAVHSTQEHDNSTAARYASKGEAESEEA